MTEKGEGTGVTYRKLREWVETISNWKRERKLVRDKKKTKGTLAKFERQGRVKVTFVCVAMIGPGFESRSDH